jgi:hypothetical protein
LYLSEIKTSNRDSFIKFCLERLNKKIPKKEFNKMLEKKNSIFIFAKNNFKMIGFLYRFRDYYLVNNKKKYFGSIDTIIFSKYHKNCGVGTKLMNECHAWFKKHKIK